MKNLKLKNPLTWVKYKLLEWHWDRILRKSGYRTWYRYFYFNDPKFDPNGLRIQDQLFGYPYIAKADYSKIPLVDTGFFGLVEDSDIIVNWCTRYCRGKFKLRWEHVTLDSKGIYWTSNPIDGKVELFVGFEDERDYTLFILRWL